MYLWTGITYLTFEEWQEKAKVCFGASQKKGLLYTLFFLNWRLLKDKSVFILKIKDAH